MKRVWKNEKGLAMVEYIIILCVIAVGSIAIVRVLGHRIKAMFENATTEIKKVESTSSTTVQESGGK